ncbi:hypothetical protein HDV62DRAFT_263199 [Trichoderma sp. SZMC 28011]
MDRNSNWTSPLEPRRRTRQSRHGPRPKQVVKIYALGDPADSATQSIDQVNTVTAPWLRHHHSQPWHMRRNAASYFRLAPSPFGCPEASTALSRPNSEHRIGRLFSQSALIHRGYWIFSSGSTSASRGAMHDLHPISPHFAGSTM